MLKFVSLAAASAFMMSAANAAEMLIDFEGPAAGTIIDDEFEPLFTVVTNSNGSNDHAVIFDSANPSGNDDDLGPTFTEEGGTDTKMPGNILIISEDSNGTNTVNCDAFTCTPADDEAGGGTITFMFSEAITFKGVDIFDVSDGNATFSIDFFGLGDALILSLVAPSGIGDDEFFSYSGLNITGVLKIVFNFGGSGAIDNLLIETSEIPVPGALPLLLSGIAGLGFASRRRKKN